MRLIMRIIFSWMIWPRHPIPLIVKGGLGNPTVYLHMLWCEHTSPRSVDPSLRPMTTELGRYTGLSQSYQYPKLNSCSP